MQPARGSESYTVLVVPNVKVRLEAQQVIPRISGFHRALLQSVTFISRLNALDYTKLRG